MLRAALVIATRNLRARLRDRSAVLFAVVIPLGLATAFALVIPRDTTFHAVYAVYDADRGHVSTAFVDDVLGALVSAGVADVERAPTEAAALAALDDGRTSAAILIPAGFSEAVTTGSPTTLRIVGLPDAPLATQVVRSVVGQFANDIEGIQLSIRVAGATPDAATIAAAQAMASPIALLADAPIARRQVASQTFYAASMTIMFLFFATSFGPLGLLGERRTGTLARLLAAPIPSGAIVLGAAITAFVLGLLSMSVLVVATTVLLGAQWGPPPLVAGLAVAAVVAATGVSMLLCTLARTEEQAGGWNSMLAITMAVLGGTMVPLTNAPELLRQLSRITPHAWFLDAVDILSDASAGFVDILPALAVLVAIGVVTGAVGLARSRAFLVAR